MKTSKVLIDPQDVVDDSGMREAIWTSGYLLERRVAGVLRNLGYRAETNRGFLDTEGNKSREYDVYAEKEIPIFNEGSFSIYPTLICECKNYRQPIVFFIQDKEEFEPLLNEVRVSGIPSKIWQRDLNKYVSVQKFTGIDKIHHYCVPRTSVATQCCTFEVKKDKSGWMANQGEELYETFRTLTKALEQEIDSDYKNMRLWLEPEETEKEFIDLSFYYPIVIFQGDIYSTHVDKNEKPEKNQLTFNKCEHIQYNPEYYSFYHNKVIYYHLDVVTEAFLPQYLEIIGKEMEHVKKIFLEQKKEIISSVNKTMNECKSLENKPSSYRKYLECEA